MDETAYNKQHYSFVHALNQILALQLKGRMGLTVLTWRALILVSLAFSVTSLAEEEEVTLGKESSLERCVVRV